MRYKLRSYKQHARCTEPRPSPECQEAEDDPGPSSLVVRRKQKNVSKTDDRLGSGGSGSDVVMGLKMTLCSLPQDVILMIVEMLDVDSALAFLRISKVSHLSLSFVIELHLTPKPKESILSLGDTSF